MFLRYRQYWLVLILEEKSLIQRHRPNHCLAGMGDLKGNFSYNYESIMFATNGKHQIRGKRDGSVWQIGMNVFIDKEGKVRRRDGRRVLSTRTGRKDGFGSGSGDCVVKCGTSLFRMGSDFRLTGLRSGMTEGKCSFSKQGKNTYYCDGVGNGVVEEGGASRTWVPQSYVGPDTIKVLS